MIRLTTTKDAIANSYDSDFEYASHMQFLVDLVLCGWLAEEDVDEARKYAGTVRRDSWVGIDTVPPSNQLFAVMKELGLKRPVPLGNGYAILKEHE